MKVKLTILLIFLSWAAVLLGQKQISGIIINDGTNDPIPFVSVGVLGRPLGTVSNQNGEFTLSIEQFSPADSIGFYFIGFETIKLGYTDLSESLVIRMQEKPIEMNTISIVAGSYKGRELLDLAIANRDSNYSALLQKREVFKRKNSASYIDRFDLALDHSTVKEIDASFAKQIEDSMIRYNRYYTDHLYTLYNSPADTIPEMGKIMGIKKVVMNEELGGEMQQIEESLEDLFNNIEKGTFWKIKTGPISQKIDEPREQKPDTLAEAEMKRKMDSLKLKHPRHLFTIDKVNNWDWDFIQKPARYKYKTQGMIPIKGEHAYIVSFKGGIGQDYVGKLYISSETFAILRIEYQLKTRKAEKGIKLLGVNYNESEDSGLVLYDRDENGYYLKYSMDKSLSGYSVIRPFQIIQKKDRRIINKRVNKISLHLSIAGRDETCNEILVVNREPFSLQELSKIEPIKVKAEKITKYSDEIWKGYSIIEPTKQMKEYQVVKRNSP